MDSAEIEAKWMDALLSLETNAMTNAKYMPACIEILHCIRCNHTNNVNWRLFIAICAGNTT